ncbi:hypothetical protein NECAME_06723, partial [Necator americanus]
SPPLSSPPNGCSCGGGGGATIQLPPLNLPTLDFPTISQQPAAPPAQIVSDAPATTYYVRQPTYRYRQVIIREPQQDVISPVYSSPPVMVSPPIYNPPAQLPSFDVPQPIYPPSAGYAVPPPSMDAPQPSYPLPPPAQDVPRPSYSLPPPAQDVPRPSYSLPPPAQDVPRQSYSTAPLPPPSFDIPRSSYSIPLSPPAQDTPSPVPSYSAAPLPAPLPSADAPQQSNKYPNSPTSQIPLSINTSPFIPPPQISSNVISPPDVQPMSPYNNQQNDAPPAPSVLRLQTNGNTGKPQMIVINMPKNGQTNGNGRTTQQQQLRMPIVIFLNQQDTNGQSKPNDDFVVINPYQRKARRNT